MIYVTHDQIEAMTLADRIAIMKNGVIQQLATPHEVYNHPVNLFVAGFIGSPTMNFLNGQINGAGQPSFALDNLNVPLGAYKFEKPAGDKVDGVLGIRPEHIAVGEDAAKMPFSARERDRDRRADGLGDRGLDQGRRAGGHLPLLLRHPPGAGPESHASASIRRAVRCSTRPAAHAV